MASMSLCYVISLASSPRDDHSPHLVNLHILRKVLLVCLLAYIDYSVVCVCGCVCVVGPGVPHLPVLGLVHSLGVGACEAALAVQGRDGGAELGHGVQVGWEVVQHGDHVGGQGGTLCPLLRHPVYLCEKGHTRHIF